MGRILPEGKRAQDARDAYFYAELCPGVRFIEARYYADAFRPVLTYEEFIHWLDCMGFPVIRVKNKDMVDMCRLEAAFSGLSRAGKPHHEAGRTVTNAEDSERELADLILELHVLKLQDGLDRSKSLRQRLRTATAQAQAALKARGSSRIFKNPPPTKLCGPNSQMLKPQTFPSPDPETTSPKRE